MESYLKEIPLPLTTEQKPEIAPNNLKPSPGIIQIPSIDLPQKERLMLQSFGLPEEVLQSYSLKGIRTMLEWQLECLSKPGVLSGNNNLIVSAPTSAGKSLVGEIIALKCVIEMKKKVLIVQPFVAAVRMTEKHLKDIFKSYRVQGFLDSFSPSGGISNIDVAICTIEKANILVSNILQEDQDNLGEIGLIIVDELHMVGDKQRGYHLDILLSKILYMKNVKMLSTNIQLVGLSTSLEKDKKIFTCWLKAKFFSHGIRPVPLLEKVKVDDVLYDTEFQEIGELDSSNVIRGDEEGILQVSKNTLLEKKCVLIFCQTKKECEDLALKLAKALPEELEQSMEIDSAKILVVDKNLENTIPKGIAFHHAGLSHDDRIAIENGFSEKLIKIVVATTTLSSSVNLPVRLVIVTSPYYYDNLKDFRTYQQMVGRAGRKGLDKRGESILICKENQRSQVKNWFKLGSMSISSFLLHCNSYWFYNTFGKRITRFNKVLLSLVDCGIASKDSIAAFYKFTLCCYQNGSDDFNDTLTESLKYLLSNKFIEVSKPPSCQMSSDAEDTANCRDEKCYSISTFGSATAWSGLSPEEALALYQHLERIGKESPHWVHYQYLVVKIGGREKSELSNDKFDLIIDKTSKDVKQAVKTLSEDIMWREKGIFRTKVVMALALNELINDGIPIERVEEKYGIARDRLQSLQHDAGNFAKMAVWFCQKLEWEKHELHFHKLKKKCLPGESQKKARNCESENTTVMSAPPQKKQKIEHQPPAAESSPAENLKLSKIVRLLNRGEFPANKAKELGTYLDVSHAKIQEFRENNMVNAKGLLIDVLNYWLDTDPEKSWSKLAEAVGDCGCGVLAEKIRQKSSQ